MLLAEESLDLRNDLGMLRGYVLGFEEAFDPGGFALPAHEVGALDPVAFTAAPIVLAIAAVVATWFPARRATRVNPLSALRNS